MSRLHAGLVACPRLVSLEKSTEYRLPWLLVIGAIRTIIGNFSIRENRLQFEILGLSPFSCLFSFRRTCLVDFACAPCSVTKPDLLRS